MPTWESINLNYVSRTFQVQKGYLIDIYIPEVLANTSVLNGIFYLFSISCCLYLHEKYHNKIKTLSVYFVSFIYNLYLREGGKSHLSI